MSFDGQVDISAGHQIDAEVQAIVKQMLVVSVDIERAQIDDQSVREEVRKRAFYGLAEVGLLWVCHG